MTMPLDYDPPETAKDDASAKFSASWPNNPWREIGPQRGSQEPERWPPWAGLLLGIVLASAMWAGIFLVWWTW